MSRFPGNHVNWMMEKNGPCWENGEIEIETSMREICKGETKGYV